MQKTFKVVMLPTEKESNIHSYIYRLGLIDRPKKTYQMNGNSQICYARHLYIISDDEIKEGDWFLSGFGSYPLQNIQGGYHEYPSDLKGHQKIVATTDTSLTTSKGLDSFSGKPNLLPQLPESFIQAYIKAYNEGKPITEVDLEMTQILPSNLPEDTKGRTISFKMMKQIKTRLDNTVIVHQSKMYSRDEVKNLIIKVHTDLASHSNTLFYEKWASKLSFYEMRDKWIEENL